MPESLTPRHGYDGQPVVLKHLAVDDVPHPENPNLRMASCQALWFDIREKETGYPIIACPGCMAAMRRRLDLTRKAHLEWESPEGAVEFIKAHQYRPQMRDVVEEARRYLIDWIMANPRR